MHLSLRSPFPYLLALAVSVLSGAWLSVDDARPASAALSVSQSASRDAFPSAGGIASAREPSGLAGAVFQEAQPGRAPTPSRATSSNPARAERALAGSVAGDPGSGIAMPRDSRGPLRAGKMSEAELRAWENERSGGIPPPAPSDSLATAPSVVAVSASSDPQLTSARMPVLAQEPAPGQQFNEQQTAKLEEMRQQFTEAVGGLEQDPADPAYSRRWEKARAAFDRQYLVTFGQQAFLLQQYQSNVSH